MMEQASLKAILFDWDLTLVHAFPVTRRALKKIGSQYQVDLSGVSMRDMYGEGHEAVLHRMHVEHHDRLPDKETFVRIVSEEMAYAHRALELIHAPLLLNLRKRGLQLGLVTYNIIENVQAVLKKSDFHFDVYVTSVEMHGHSNKAKGIRSALDQLKVGATEALYVGDTIDDIVSAREIGIPVAAVTTGVFTREELEKAKPTYIIDSLTEVESLL